jgi:hypothetical protein
VHLFDIEANVVSRSDRETWGSYHMRGDRHLRSENEPAGLTIHYLLTSNSVKGVEITVQDADGNDVASLEGTTDTGLNRVQWNTAESEAAIAPGVYTVTLVVGRERISKSAVLKPPRAFAIGPASGPMEADR